MKSAIGVGRKRGSSRQGTTSQLEDFFPAKKKERSGGSSNNEKKQSSSSKDDMGQTTITNPQAEAWGRRLQELPSYLTADGRSWVVMVKKWLPTESQEEFKKQWDLHPTRRHELQIFGRTVLEKRWSQSWGVSYAYSGTTNQARPLEESPMITSLLETVNKLAMMDDDDADKNNIEAGGPYNGCLQNWYTPEDSIGLHADDEKNHKPDYPIFSLTWGGTRRFLLRRKQKVNKGSAAVAVSTTNKSKNKNDLSNQDPVELILEDGDLLVMGGTCQETHKHEVPKLRATKDPPTSNRINWTLRAFR
jgi:alkylated DNA repair dioxygenase AlkB